MLYAEKMPWALSNRKNSTNVTSNDPLMALSPKSQEKLNTESNTTNTEIPINTTNTTNNNEILDENNDPVTPIENRTNIKFDLNNDEMNQNNVNVSNRRVFIYLYYYKLF